MDKTPASQQKFATKKRTGELLLSRSYGRTTAVPTSNNSSSAVKTADNRYFTALTIASNALGSFIARSAKTLRFIAIPFALYLPINSE